MQAATLNDADIQRLRRARVLECEADFMAATVTSQRLRALGASEIDHFKAGSRISDYIRTHSTGSANAQYYPAAEMRALTISLAWRYAVDSTLVRWAPSDTIASRGRRDPAAFMRDVCEMAANVHDGSIGNISMREMRQELTAGSEAPPMSATSRTVEIENYGRQPVVLSYMLIARGFRSTGADDENHEVFDAVRDTVVVPAGERIERSYSLETYAPANYGDGFRYQTILTPYASPFATNTFISARYPASQPENDFCFERISGLDSSSDRALLTRLATVALAAQENFRPVAASTFVDQAGNSRRYDLIGALQGDSDDNIRVYGSPWMPGPSAEIVAFRSERTEDVLRELTRLKQRMALVCGMSNVIPDTLPALNPIAQRFNIRRFAPSAFVQLGATLFSGASQEGGTTRDRGGIVYFNVARDVSW